ncbi:MAG: hypothetical protein ACOY5B_07560 [Spirochaetota bacterium]
MTRLVPRTTLPIARLLLLAVSLSLVPALHGYYGLAGMLPGDAVDPLTDVSQYSFAVPHAVRGLAVSSAPSYSYASRSYMPDAEHLHQGNLPVFALYQFERLRLALSSENRITASSGGFDPARSQNRAMLGYLWSRFSLAMEGGATHLNEGGGFYSRSAEGALAASVYGVRWGIDGVYRIVRPIGAQSDRNLLPHSEEVMHRQDLQSTNQLYSLRFRGDFSYAWRYVVSGNYLSSAQTDFVSLSQLFRYRLGTLQVLSGLQYYFHKSNTFQWQEHRVNLPVHLILEHGSSVFYLSGASPIFVHQSWQSGNIREWGLRFVPRVAYLYRFSSRWWMSLNVAEQSLYVADGSNSHYQRKEVYASLRLTYNIAPFGFDDEVPAGDYVAAMH